jgi:sulfur-oxidizing protein SoxZ
MADRKMKMRTRLQDGVVELQILITHPMETGLRTDKNTNAKIPPHFIQKVNVELNGKVVVVVNTGTAILKIRCSDSGSVGDGDKLKVF